MNRRQRDILVRLLFEEGPMTGSTLAKEFMVSARTVRSDIKVLNSDIAPYAVKIHSSKQVGYFIEDKDKKTVHDVIEKLKLAEEVVNIPNSPIERMAYIILRLSFADDYIGMEKIADDIFVSKTTIMYDIKRITENMQNFPDLRLIVSNTKGVWLEGSEISKRALIYSAIIYEITDRLQDSIHRLQYLFKEPHVYEDIIEFQKLIINLLNLHESFLTDQDILLLSIEYYICMRRIKASFGIDQPMDETLDYNTLSILQHGFNKFVDDPGIDEFKYLMMRFYSKRLLNKNIERTQTHNGESREIVDRFLKEIKSKFGIDFLDNQNLIGNLNQHINPLIYRLKTHTFEVNPLQEETRRKYPFAFEVSNALVYVIKEKYGLLINESELTYISLHIAVALDELSEKPSVAIVCGSGLGTAQLLYTKMLSYYGERIHLLGWYGLHQLQGLLEGEYGEVDFIVSTVPIMNDKGIPILQVSPLLNKSDLSKIEKHIQFPVAVTSLTQEVHPHLDFFHPALFEYVKQPGDYFQLLRRLADRLAEQHFIDDAEAFCRSVIEREQMQSTVLADLIALPHAMDYTSRETVITVCILEEPIKHSGRKIKLILLVAINPKEKEKLQNLYGMIGKILEMEDIKELTSAESLQEFLNYLA